MWLFGKTIKKSKGMNDSHKIQESAYFWGREIRSGKESQKALKVPEMLFIKLVAKHRSTIYHFLSGRFMLYALIYTWLVSQFKMKI